MSGLLGQSSGGGGNALTLASIFSSLSGENAVTAFATGGQASATQLLSTVALHRISVCVTANDSVKLPAATLGQIHYVRNDGAASCQLYGLGTDTINAVASGTGIPLGAGMGIWCECTIAGAWTTTPVSIIRLGDGTAALPSFSFASSPGYGLYVDVGRGTVNLTANTTNPFAISSAGLRVGATRTLAWLTTDPSAGATADTGIARASAQSLLFGDGTASTAVSKTETNKLITAIADNVATAALTVTVPNAAHSASIRVKAKGSSGAGGAIGANESTRSAEYAIDIARTAGVAAVATISAIGLNPAAAIVAGGNGITVTVTLSAISGAVGAPNTFTINVTIARAASTATNHTCFMQTSLINDTATGITIA